MSTTSRTRRQRATPSVGVTSPRGSTDARRRSPQASQALDLFDRVRRFFAHDSQLAQALGWDESTTAKWRDHSVTRPHAAKVAQVLLLQELCEEARAYMLDDFDVGTWLNAPLPNLHGSSPASWLRERRGWRGLRRRNKGGSSKLFPNISKYPLVFAKHFQRMLWRFCGISTGCKGSKLI